MDSVERKTVFDLVDLIKIKTKQSEVKHPVGRSREIDPVVVENWDRLPVISSKYLKLHLISPAFISVNYHSVDEFDGPSRPSWAVVRLTLQSSQRPFSCTGFIALGITLGPEPIQEVLAGETLLLIDPHKDNPRLLYERRAPHEWEYKAFRELVEKS